MINTLRVDSKNSDGGMSSASCRPCEPRRAEYQLILADLAWAFRLWSKNLWLNLRTLPWVKIVTHYK